jgi:mxaJ protein
MHSANPSSARRFAAALAALAIVITCAPKLAQSRPTSELQMAAVPAAATPGIRLARGFAHDVQRAKDALANANESEAGNALDAARRLAIVLDTAAPVPRPTSRLEWIDAVRSALERRDVDRAKELLAPADERTLAQWAAPHAGPSDPRAYVGAAVVDAVGAQIGQVAAVRGGGLEIHVPAASAGGSSTTITVRVQDVFAGSEPPSGPAVVAAPTLNPRALRVCADPNNLPFSDQRERGFENKLAQLLARELGAELQYTWWPARRGFLRTTLNAYRCDLVMGVPTGYERVLTTRPVYRSSYVVVFGPRAPRVSSIEAPELRSTRIGVPLVGDDGANPPAIDALVRHGLTQNLRGYPVYGDYRTESPPAELIRAVSRGEIDLAVAWGPLAGYFANQVSPPLAFAALTQAGAAFSFDISLAVRREDEQLVAELDLALERRRIEIDAILASYHVPRAD